MPTLSKNISKARLSYKLLLECLYLRMSGPGRNRHFQQFPRKMVVTNFLFLTIQDQVYMRKCWGYIRLDLLSEESILQLSYFSFSRHMRT